MPSEKTCPCGSGKTYAECCRPLHSGETAASTAEALMRSRYSAFVLQQVDYIVETTVPAQQPLLDKAAIAAWSKETEWLGLEVSDFNPNLGKQHALVEFTAHFREKGETLEHFEISVFVNIDGRWYFLDPTVELPTMKQPCVCGSGKKFKACCGRFL
ncbi:YchJ family protein [Neisseria chenwenguii]|uniref:UPF0225 protein BG910_03825 n=1 Tax=Neisseria chenwenguii TaxID=1853278 RepID=A0A220S4K6_9NEIS|nr:YchJ family protein [Neisseria chenwenguii]ASK28441.1 SEC-C motif-containing protein [Neisseria chenwenguii]ROV56157.1 YchJ family protein [Neisseria chenwenguii]